MNDFRVTRITVYPIKSLDGIERQNVFFHDGGGLQYDRRYAIRDAKGRWVNGKSTPELHRLRTRFDEAFEHVQLSTDETAYSPWLSLRGNRGSVNEYLSDFLRREVYVDEDDRGGFQDDPVKNQLTLVSVPSLLEVCRWYPGMSLDECRQRFRANVEITARQPFEEETWLKTGWITVGSVRLSLTKPVPRCVVPSRDPLTGDGWSGFQKTFSQQREQIAAEGSASPVHSHGYFLSVGSIRDPASSGRSIGVNDIVMT